MMYAEALFARFDADADGCLDGDQAQLALQLLTPRPKDGAPKPPVAFACPPGAFTEAGELRLPKPWFMMLFRSMK